MNLNIWFPTVVGTSYFPGAGAYADRMTSHLEKIEDTSNQTFFPHKIHQDENFRLLNDWVKQEINKYCEAHTFKNLKVMNSWFNDYKKGDAQHSHFHPGSMITAVYFLKGSPDDVPLVIKSPLPADMMNPRDVDPSRPDQNYNDLTAENLIIKPEQGLLVIFRSFIEHEVGLKITKEPRITITYLYSL